jgi:site-specific DNA-adenine methylase
MQNNIAKPFIKWTGGKCKLISQFQEYYPKSFIIQYDFFQSF